MAPLRARGRQDTHLPSLDAESRRTIAPPPTEYRRLRWAGGGFPVGALGLVPAAPVGCEQQDEGGEGHRPPHHPRHEPRLGRCVRGGTGVSGGERVMEAVRSEGGGEGYGHRGGHLGKPIMDDG